MGYLEDVVAKLEELMRTRGLTEEHRQEIGAYFRKHVLASYRNGVEKGRQERDDKRRPPGRRKERK
jgi:hypothetical protein